VLKNILYYDINNYIISRLREHKRNLYTVCPLEWLCGS